MANKNKGKYGEDFSKAPTQAKGESREAYNQRLKEWQRRRSAGGSSSSPKQSGGIRATQVPTHANPGGWMDKVTETLKKATGGKK